VTILLCLLGAPFAVLAGFALLIPGLYGSLALMIWLTDRVLRQLESLVRRARGPVLVVVSAVAQEAEAMAEATVGVGASPAGEAD
jgi:hypothetical protein